MRSLKNSPKNFEYSRVFHPLYYANYRRNLAMLNNYCITIGREMQRKNKNSYDKAMALKPAKTVSSSTNNRQLHVSSVSKIARLIGEDLGLNLKLIEVMAEQHDRGHTPYAHEVELIFNTLLKDYGIGHFSHNAEGPRQFLFVEDIDQICIDSIHRSRPELSQIKLDKLSELLWYIHDASLCHNGESAKFEFRPDIYKTKQDFLADLKQCFIQENYHRKLAPATIEGCDTGISDIISYIGQDLADGLQEGLITELDAQYIDILSAFDIPENELKAYMQKQDYDSIVRIVEDKCIADVVAHSSKDVITFSDNLGKYVDNLRHRNYSEIIRKNITPREEEILSRTVRSSIDLLSSHLIKGRFLSELLNEGKVNINHDIQTKYPDEKYKGFVRFLGKLGPKYIDYVKELCEDGTRASIMEETQIAIECIRKGWNSLPEPQNEKDKKAQEETPMRTKRINNTIDFIQRKYGTDLSNFEPEDFCNRIMNKLRDNKPVDGYLTLNERIATLISTNFLATLSDKEFRYFIKVNDLITPEEHAILKTKYPDIPEDAYGYSSSLRGIVEWQNGQKRLKDPSDDKSI